MTRHLWASLSLIAVLITAPMALSFPAQAATETSDNPGISVDVVIPGATAISVTDAQLRWGLNQEVTSGAYFGGCHFLSAGTAGDTGSSRIWTLEDGLYAASQANTRIEKPDSAGKWVIDSWNGKCLAANGKAVGTTAKETGTGAQAVIDGGTGTINAGEGSASIQWRGSFTVAMYGGMTYWSVIDPILSVENGKGTLRAEVSGYAADRSDTTSWSSLPKRMVTLATLPNVALGDKGIVTDPAYRKVLAAGVEPIQNRDGGNANWGAFPQDFLDFQTSTGQGAYWYSSGGLRDAAKVASTLYISYSADIPVTIPIPAIVTPTSPPTATSGGSLPAVPATAAPQQASGTVTGTAPVAGIVRTAATPVAQTMNWLGGSFIPQVVDIAKNHRDALLWSSAALLGLSAFTWVGFKRRWLQLPFLEKSTRN
ncbi:hypothetical protein CVS30_00265 [Arthrobacter psychrolactophilus]|uniref:Htaa domain-containing protein n=1 Tax=Arthrobacter psychrolactophilus TaxID=92442 RepID=A0A2V5J9T3_9MICC|nr:hypothetical protein [Arthrobacter psychrolactophilus]PYI40010.1 hypothetical protein CVS30_00265 [Arthrobacter psychrolactophilus]